MMNAPLPLEVQDVRFGGRWTAAQRAKNDLLFAAASVSLGAVRLFSHAALVSVGRTLGLGLCRLLPGAVALADANLGLVFPDLPSDERATMVRRTFRSLGENLGDALALLRPAEPAGRGLRLDATSANVLDGALSGGRGVVYVTAHLGRWERMAAFLAGLGFPITTLARESYDPRFDRALYDPLRARRGVQAIYRGGAGSDVALSVVRALARGRVVGFPMDLPGRGVLVTPVSLLGQPSHLPIGPARIALARRAAVVVGTPAPDPAGGYHVRIEELDYADLSPDGDASAQRLTQRMADALTGRILALPHEWPWMFPSFRKPERGPPARGSPG